MGEAEIQARGMALIGSREDCRVFRMNIGRARDPRSGRVIQFGIPGMSDLLIMLQGGGVLWLEVKTSTGRQSEQQRRFAEVCERFGHAYRIAREPADFVRHVEEVLRGADRDI